MSTMPGLLRRARSEFERQRRATEWLRWFSGDSTESTYRRELVRVTGLEPELAWELVRDLAPLLVGRVPATLGVPVLLATSVLVADLPKPTEASWALLAATLEELEPAHARTVLESLALAWQRSYGAFTSEERQRSIRAELQRTIRRLVASDAPGIDALTALLTAFEGGSDRHSGSAILKDT